MPGLHWHGLLLAGTWSRRRTDGVAFTIHSIIIAEKRGNAINTESISNEARTIIVCAHIDYNPGSLTNLFNLLCAGLRPNNRIVNSES